MDGRGIPRFIRISGHHLNPRRRFLRLHTWNPTKGPPMHPGYLALALFLGSPPLTTQETEASLDSLQDAVSQGVARELGSPLRNLEDLGACLDLASEGSRALVIGSHGTLVVYDPRTGEEFHREEPLGDLAPILWGAFLPGNDEVVILQDDEDVAILEVATGQRRILGHFPGARGPATYLEPGGRHLISNTLTFDEDGYQVSHLARFELESATITTSTLPLDSWVRHILVTPDGGEALVQVDGVYELLRFDLEALVARGNLPLTDEATALALSPDGTRLAYAILGELKVLDYLSGKESGTYGFDGLDWIDVLAFGPSGKTLFVSQEDVGYMQMDSSTGEPSVSTLGSGLGALEVVASEEFILMSTYEGLLCHDPRTGAEVGRAHAMDGVPWTLAWSPDGQRIAAGTNQGDFAVYDTTTGFRTGGAPGNPAPYLGIAWTGEQDPWISCDHQLGLATWSSDGGDDPSMIREVEREVWDFALAGDLVWALGRSGETLWSFDTRSLTLGAEVSLEGDLYFELVPRPGSMGALLMGTVHETEFEMDRNRRRDEVCADGTAYNAAPLAGGAWVRIHDDGRITRGDGLSGLRDWTLARHPLAGNLWSTEEAPFYHVTSSPDGKRFVLASNTHVSLFDGTSGDHIAEIPTPLHTVSALAWSEDGRSLALGIQNESILVIDVEAWAAIGVQESLYGDPAQWAESNEEVEDDPWSSEIEVSELRHRVTELEMELLALEEQRHHEQLMAEQNEYSLRSQIESLRQHNDELNVEIQDLLAREEDRYSGYEEERAYWVEEMDRAVEENERMHGELEEAYRRIDALGASVEDPDASKSELKAEHERLLLALRSRIEEFRKIHGVVPPGSVAELRDLDPKFEGLVDGERKAFSSNEALVLALGLADDEEWRFDLSNSDFDYHDEDLRALEVLDPWAWPWVYIPASDYEQGAWTLNAEFEETLVPARRKPDGSFKAPKGYQLFSLGPR